MLCLETFAAAAVAYKVLKKNIANRILGRVDIDGDGEPDALMLDTTGDGEFDTIILNTEATEEEIKLTDCDEPDSDTIEE